jgi:hypothetical protein
VLTGGESWRPDAAVARVLLADADALAAKGRYAEAAHLLLRRSVQDIEGSRPRLVRPALTSRDIAAHPGLPDAARSPSQPSPGSSSKACSADAAPTRPTGAARARPTPPSPCPACWRERGGEAAPTFRPAVVLWMIAVGVLAFVAFFVLLAYAPDLRRGTDGRAHALSTSAVGYAGLVRLMRAHGHDVTVSREEGGREGFALQVVTPDADDDADDIAAVTGDGNLLVVLPKWATTPDPARADWVRKAGVIPASVLAPLLDDVSTGAKLHRARGTAPASLRGVEAPFAEPTVLALGAVATLQTAAGPNLQPVLTTPEGRIVLGRVNNTGVYLLTDPDLLNNRALKLLAGAELAEFIVHQMQTQASEENEYGVLFDVTLNGFGRGRSVLRLALEPPFLAATLCVLAAALLTGVHAAARFGPPRLPGRAVALGKRALADNAAALIRLAKREPRMAPRYAALVGEQVARAVGAPRDLGPEQTGAFLDRLGARAAAGPTLTELTAQAGAVRDSTALMRSAQALHRWRTEMTRGR